MTDLGKIGIFSSLGPKDLGEAERHFLKERYPKKEVIFSEGDPSGWLYIVLAGKVKITKISHDGKEIILEVIPPLDFFGAMALLKGFPYPANAVAMEDVELLKISKKDLFGLLERHPRVMLAITQNMGLRIKEFHDTLRSVALEKMDARVASLLLKLSEKSGNETPDGISLDMRLTRQDIAEMVGTTVETSIRTMSKLKKMGVISERAGKIVIKDEKRLREMIVP